MSGRPHRIRRHRSLRAAGQASAHLQNFVPGNDVLQIDTNGDGTGDMDISLQNYTGNAD